MFSPPPPSSWNRANKCCQCSSKQQQKSLSFLKISVSDPFIRGIWASSSGNQFIILYVKEVLSILMLWVYYDSSARLLWHIVLKRITGRLISLFKNLMTLFFRSMTLQNTLNKLLPFSKTLCCTYKLLMSFSLYRNHQQKI